MRGDSEADPARALESGGLMIVDDTAANLRLLTRMLGAAGFRVRPVVSGEAAHRIGFVNRLGDLDAALEWAGAISLLAPLTIAGHKLMLNRLEPAPAPDPEVAAAFGNVHADGRRVG